MKRLNSALLIFAIFISFAISMNAQSKWKLSDKLPLESQVRTGKLENGLTYFIRKNSKPENRAELQIVIRAGALQEDNDQLGLAHFTEHMCFNGTKNFPLDQLVKFLETTGMRFGADVNANTGFDRTYYMLTIPLDSVGLLDKGLLVLEDWLSNVSFDAEEIEKERGVIIEEWRLRMNAQSRVFEKHFDKVAFGTDFPKRMPIGDTLIIKTAPKEAFTRFYNEFYRPNISALIVVGDIDVDKMENTIKKNFSDVKNPVNARPIVEAVMPMHKDIKVSIAKDKELQMPTYVLYWKHETPKDEMTYGAYRRQLMNGLISQMLSLRMQELTRKANPPYLQAGGSYGGFLAGADAFTLFVVPKVDNMNKGYEVGLTEVYRAKNHGFTKGELERAKTETLRSYEKALQEKDKTESSSFARELYAYFHEKEGMPGIVLENEMAKQFMSDITIEEINKAMKSYIRDESLVITVSVPDKPEIKVPTENEIMATYKAVSTADIAAYEDDDVKKPLMEKKPVAGKIEKETKNEKLGTTEFVLSNGARVLVKPTDYKNDQVLMRSYSFGGSSLISDADYYSASTAASIVDEGGISEFTSTQLEKLLTGKMAGVSPYISELTEGFNGNYSPQDAETFFQLLYLYFTNPRKDTEAFESFLAKTKEQIKNAASSPEQVFRDSVSVVLGQHHFRSLPWTNETLNKINLDKAFKIYQERFANAGDFNFIFIGNVDMAKFKEFITTYIASLPSKKGEKENFKDIGKRYPKTATKKEVKKGIEPKCTARLAIAGDFDWTRQNRFDFYSMIEVLSIRLREVIREDKGGVYGIGARGQLNLYPAKEYIISVSFGTSPVMIEDLVKTTKDVMKEIIDNGVKEEYVTKVKEILRRERETGMKENNWWMGQIYNADMNKTDLNEIIDYNTLIDNLSAKEIQAAAKKYLKLENFIEMVLYPED